MRILSVDIKREDLFEAYKALLALVDSLGISSILVDERDGTVFISHQSTENFTILPVAKD